MSRPASARLSVMISEGGGASGSGGVTAADLARAAGMESGAAPSFFGISIGMSTGMGRGWVSNSRGKPMTPMITSTSAPMSRLRARVRACCTASGASAADAAFEAGGTLLRKNDVKPMRCACRRKRRRSAADVARRCARDANDGPSAGVRGAQAGQALLQHATHRVEGTEDNDSISGVCSGQGRLERGMRP